MKWLIVLFALSQAFSLPDLEEKTSSFILETKKLEIPEYPLAFNPSIVKFENGYLLSFRIIPERTNKYDTRIGLIRLDSNFNPIGSAQILQTRKIEDLGIPRGEDGRLIWVGNDLYLVFSDCPDLKMSKGCFRMHIAKIVYDGTFFELSPPERITQFPNQNPNVREKSWTPFDFEGKMLLSYSQFPHLILSPQFGTSCCYLIAETASRLLWDWGIVRGGTAAQIEDDEYLSFFHSTISMASLQSDGQLMPHYFMGAYTFAKTPPFQIMKMSQEPIVAKGFYSGEMHKPYHVPIRCIFPCGYVSDDRFIWVVYGRQDHESWIVKLDKKELLKSLKPVDLLEMGRD